MVEPEEQMPSLVQDSQKQGVAVRIPARCDVASEAGEDVILLAGDGVPDARCGVVSTLVPEQDQPRVPRVETHGVPGCVPHRETGATTAPSDSRTTRIPIRSQLPPGAKPTKARDPSPTHVNELGRIRALVSHRSGTVPVGHGELDRDAAANGDVDEAPYNHPPVSQRDDPARIGRRQLQQQGRLAILGHAPPTAQLITGTVLEPKDSGAVRRDRGATRPRRVIGDLGQLSRGSGLALNASTSVRPLSVASTTPRSDSSSAHDTGRPSRLHDISRGVRSVAPTEASPSSRHCGRTATGSRSTAADSQAADLRQFRDPDAL